MFEDRIAEKILQEMLSEAADVDTSEGSLMYEACAKAAVMIERTYVNMSRLYDNLSIDEMEEEFFITFASDRGVERIPAMSPVVRCEFLQEIDIGSRFTCNDYDYTIISHDAGYNYTASCDTPGIDANNNMGELEPIDYVDDWKGGNITRILTYGSDIEDLDKFKKRFKQRRYQIKAFAGNRQAYREMVEEYAKEYGGVSACIPCRTTDKEIILLWVVSSEYRALSKESLAAIQRYIDPPEASGEGYGTAPIGHSVVVKTPEEVDINVKAVVTLDEGYEWDTIAESIKILIENYFLSVRKLWESNKKAIIRVSQIEYSILSVSGVLDCTGTTLNGQADNIALDYTKIPVFGGVENI